MKYKGAYSSLFSLPGGGPQGSLLGLFLFLVLIDDIGFDGQSNNVGELITRKKKVQEVNQIHLKYVDDLDIAESVDMKTQLMEIPEQERSLPAAYRSKTGYKLKSESSKISEQLNRIHLYAQQNGMKLNLEKTKLMLFNPCVSRGFNLEITIATKRIELVERTKLLGVVLTSDLKWEENTQYIIQKCNSKVWMLRRLKKLGASKDDLIDVYFKQIRNILEFASPVWNPSLTGDDIINLERVQKTVLHIILGDNYMSYSSALKISGLQKLSERRKKLSLAFAKKTVKSSKLNTWFRLNQNQGGRTNQPKFCPVSARPERFKKSPISELIKILNNQ